MILRSSWLTDFASLPVRMVPVLTLHSGNLKSRCTFLYHACRGPFTITVYACVSRIHSVCEFLRVADNRTYCEVWVSHL